MPTKGLYYIPQGDHEFLDWTLNFVQGASENAAAWDLILADIAAIKAKSDDFAQKLEASLGSDASKADIRAKNTAHHETQTAFRDYVNEKIRFNHKIDDDGRAALRVHVQDTTRTTIPKPKNHVAFSVKPVNAREHRIDYRDEESGKKAVPYGYNGVVLYRKVLEAEEPVPIDPVTLPESKLLTSTPHIEEFLPSDQGKRAVYAAAWQNEKGEQGPFSDVQVHIVP
ncbi:hypothetical protein ACYULU_14360 [Breznakiellaceae bacterium SP9]